MTSVRTLEVCIKLIYDVMTDGKALFANVATEWPDIKRLILPHLHRIFQRRLQQTTCS